MLLHLVFLLSGVAGLGYELVWTRMFAVGLGHEMPSLLGIVAAFFGGLALGAWALDRPIRASRTPGLWYAGLEVVMGTWAFATIPLIPRINEHLGDIIGLTPSAGWYWFIAFAVPFVSLVPATAAMGATLPAMDQFVGRLTAGGRSVAGLYAANTIGAVAGTLGSTFVLLPAWGFTKTLGLLALVNFACAAAVAILARTGSLPGVEPEHRTEMGATGVGAARIQMTLFVAGLLGIGYEVLGVRVLGQVLQNTVYSFASGLSAYLLATALGAAVYQARFRQTDPAATLARLLQVLAVSCLGGLLVLAYANPLIDALHRSFGDGFGPSLAAEISIALIVFGVPCFFMGAVFSHLAWIARLETGGIGRGLSMNTVGATLAPLVFGVWLIPAFGPKTTVLAIACGYVLLVPRPSSRTAVWALPIALLAVFPVRAVIVDAPAGGSVLAYEEGRLAAVSVVADADGRRFLKINNQYREGGTGSGIGERLQAHIPLLLHPSPHRALFLGVGAGVTVGAVSAHPGLQADAVELLPEVLDVLSYFDDVSGAPELQPRLHLSAADARRYVRAARTSYDVVVADLFHPSRDGSGALYTREHFEAVRERLAPGGLFCQWLPLYEMDLETARAIARSFVAVFPESRAYVAYFVAAQPVLALVGTSDPVTYPPDWWARRVADPRLRRALDGVGLTGDLALFGHLIAGKRDLAAFARSGRLNTDDQPFITFHAPRFAYRARPPAYTNLELLLNIFRPKASDLVAAGGSAGATAFSERLDSYLAARNLYIAAEIAQARGLDDRALDDYVASVKASHEFAPGRDAALHLATELARVNPNRGRTIIEALNESAPAVP